MKHTRAIAWIYSFWSKLKSGYACHNSQCLRVRVRVHLCVCVKRERDQMMVFWHKRQKIENDCIVIVRRFVKDTWAVLSTALIPSSIVKMENQRLSTNAKHKHKHITVTVYYTLYTQITAQRNSNEVSLLFVIPNVLCKLITFNSCVCEYDINVRPT